MLGRRLGHFRVEGLVGAGGMGEVYRAVDERLDREVAIKVLPEAVARDPERLARFEREARALARLSHPNILAVHEFAREGDIAYVVTELLRGETLRQRLCRERLPWRKAVEIAAGVADGLASAHAHGVVHRDLKPENLFLTSDGLPRILDFGLARFETSLDSEELTLQTPASVTRPGVVLGTHGYLAPEQAHGEPGDARSDIFALGCVMFEMLTGQRAFTREAADDGERVARGQPAPNLSDLALGIPPEVARIVAHCLEPAREDRFQSARDLAFDLRASLTSAVPTGPVRPQAPAPRPWRRWAAVIGLATALLAAAAGAWLGTRTHAPPQGGLPAGPRARIVVLPFENLGTTEDAYFAAGMTEEITSRLAGVRALAVASRTSAMEYDRRGKTLRKIGSDLGVDFVLEGTVRWDRSRDGPGRVRITPQLIRVADDSHLWAATYEREMADVFALQSEVAADVVSALGQTLSPGEASAVGRVPTTDLAAYDLYLRASRIAASSYDARENAEAVRLLTDAVARDPRFAEAHAALARRHLMAYWLYHDRTSACLERARLSAERAVVLAPDRAATRLALGYYYYMGHLDYDRALVEVREVLRTRPDDSEALALEAFVSRRAGRIEEAARLLERVVATDPGSAYLWHNLSETYLILRRYPDAERGFDRAIALSPSWGREYAYEATVRLCEGRGVTDARAILARIPAGEGLREADAVAEALVQLDFLERRYDQAASRARSLGYEAFSSQWAYVPLSQVVADALRLKGDLAAARRSYEAALSLVERELKQRPEDPRLHSAQGLILAGLGRREEAVRAARTGVDRMPISREAYRGLSRAEDLARVHAIVGDPDAAISILEDLQSRPGRSCAPVLALDPAWDGLRRHPRFAALLRQTR